MSASLLLCVLPAERAALAPAVAAAGGSSLVDLTCAARPSEVDVPDGAWVRVLAEQLAAAPGNGPVVVVGEVDDPVEGRPTWIERTVPGPIPPGFAGMVLRGREVGGPCGARSGLKLLDECSEPSRVLLDAGLSPQGAAAAVASGARGVLLSDVLLGLPELELPPRLAEQLSRADSSTSHLVNGVRVQCSPLAPVLRRLLGAESFWDLSRDWLSADDPSRHAWPAGLALPLARALAEQYGGLAPLLAAYSEAMETGPSELVSYVAEAQPVVRTAEPTLAFATEPPIDASVGAEIAIVGLGCRFPGANSIAAFWDNVLSSRYSITEVPPDRWDPTLYWDPDPKTPDRTYARIGGFLTDFEFEPRRFRIPPNVARLVDPVQQIALESVADALEDAGLAPDPRAVGREVGGRLLHDFDRNRTAVILGNSMGGEVTDDYTVRVRYPAIRQALEQVPDFAALPDDMQKGILASFEEGVKQSLPPITEDSMPGELANVIAGRVANAFDLTGPNFTVDAACASSMAALQAAVKGLQDGDFDVAVSGGADRSMGVRSYIEFCKIGALSADGSMPFDQRANGFVMGEGCGILILKRLADAERDGDRIYAVVRGIGASSDGKGKGITAPNPRGQHLALQRAYSAAGIDPVEIDLVECHGTSTVVGDKVEVEALSSIIGAGRRGARGPVRIGSVKSNIGHLKSAAGAASCVKVALALFHKVLPPTVNFQSSRPDVRYDAVPLQVQTAPEPWQSDRPRLAGVSAFGFGGTNFHVVLGEYIPGRAAVDVAAGPPSAESVDVPVGLWAASADSRDDLAHKLETAQTGPFEPGAPVRMAAAAASQDERAAQVQRTITVLRKGQRTDLLRSRGISFEDEPFDGKLAFLFTGQGSQYVDMGLDLAEAFPVVKATFDEADEVMRPELGRPLTDLIRRDPSMSQVDQDEQLRRTEISQPATLAIDIALLRLLAAYGVAPDMVAGHSLGEYSAAVAAGMLSFEHALIAVSARGREMANVQIPDKGRMASIAGSVEMVSEVLAEVPGYVVAANKNCPTQTVIAGESDAVEAALEAFRSRGITVFPLPVSHAFHSRIVAPASEPLRKVLERLDIRPPSLPITTNVSSRYYPTGDGAREVIIDILARQVASPVEWIAQVERMYADGARVFVECGPKRALAGFIVNILNKRPHRAIHTNHPKRGGVQSFQDALAALLTLGLPIRPSPTDTLPDSTARPEPRLATTDAVRSHMERRGGGRSRRVEANPTVVKQILDIVAEATGYDVSDLRLDDDMEADLGIDTVKLAEVVAQVRDRFKLDHDPVFRLSDHRSLRDLAEYAARRMGATRPATPTARSARPASAVEHHGVPAGGPALPAPPAPASGATQPQPPAGASAEVLAQGEALARAMTEGAVRAGLGGGEASGVASAVMPAFEQLLAAMVGAVKAAVPPPPERETPLAPPRSAPTAAAVTAGGPSRAADPVVVCSGASVGLPGGTEVFAPDNFQRVLDGENRIDRIDATYLDRFLTKSLVQLHKDAQSGQGTFVPVESHEQVIRLAGVTHGFDLAAQYGVDPALVRATDVTTRLGIAAGLEALHDAGIPLVRRWRETTTGKRVPLGWGLPDALRDDTGIIFASAFPGYSALVDHIQHGGDDGEGHFDRRFLFQILAMGHSQLAQLIGARGPNVQVNSACASSTTAVAVAQDWIRAGRAARVLIVGADDVTNESLLEWIGSGFVASGAATTKDRVEDAALPFDRRRHGMILGAGAVGMVIERQVDTAARGTIPLARLLGSRISNSAFHGSRLDVDHICGEMDRLVEQACAAAGVDRAAFARQAMFMSHETYTPAKGGSAAAEIGSLRHAFGDAASGVTITNTKGFTGHAMGAGLEDAIVLKALQFRRAPPIPNLLEPDPDLGDLTLSSGGPFSGRFAIRLAAGFGSQLALLAWEKIADGEQRVSDSAARDRWLGHISGYDRPRLVVEDRTLRVVEEVASAAASPPAVAAQPPSTAPPAAAPSADLLTELLAVIAVRTGYSPDELDPDYELEADLGIDTVKQAEIFGEMRDRFGIARADDFKLAEYPTIAGLAAWLSERAGAGAPQPVTEVTDEAAEASAEPTVKMAPEDPAPQASGSGGRADRAEVEAALLAIVAEKTGYSTDELDVEFELEADLGIDTVKQAEIFSEVRDRFEIPRDDDFRLADYPTIAGLTDWLAAHAGGGTGTATVASPTSPAAESLAGSVAGSPAEGSGLAQLAAPPQHVGDDSVVPDAGVPDPRSFQQVRRTAVSRADVQDVLVGILSAKTGYTPEELDPEFELEADLGVDTVKQAEIFAELRDHFELSRDDDFKLADHPTIAGLAGWVADQLAAATVSEDPDIAVLDSISRADMDDVPASVRGRSAIAGALLGEAEFDDLLSDPTDLPTARAVRRNGSSRAASVEHGLPPSFRIRRPVLVERPAWAMGTLRGRVVQVLGDSALSQRLREEILARGGRVEGAPDAVVDAGENVLSAFDVARELDKVPPTDWVCVSRLGTDPSWVAFEQGCEAGARAGLAKSLGREWEGCHARVLDLDPTLADLEAAVLTCEELAAGDGATEIFRDPDHRRVVALRVEPMPPLGGRLPGCPVIVLTGGTRGITARVAIEFASRGACKLALLARTPPGEEPLDEASAKAEIKAKLVAAKERATPARVERALKPLRAAEEARQNVAEMQSLGAEVSFFKADLADRAAVRVAFAMVRERYGDIDGVVHGAGLEESRLLAAKDRAAFSRVFDGKALGGLAIAEELEPHAWMVSMGSVAGRFGNAGQVDYAAANEAMARICLSRARSLHVDWTAWGDVGMAVRGGMDKLLTDRGVELLPADAGARLLVDMVAAGVTGEVVVAGRLGDFTVPPSHPLIDGVDLDGDDVVVTRELSADSDPWINDHAIGGTPVLPGVIGLELMVAAASLALPGRSYAGARDVSFKAPVKVHRGDPVKLVVRAEPLSDDEVRCTLSSERIARTGRVLRTDHFEGVVFFGPYEPPPALPPAFFAEEPINRGAIYRRFFHGPAFQVLRDAGAVALEGLLADAVVEHAFVAGGLLSAPLALEAAFQAAGLHRLAIDGQMALPHSIREVCRTGQVVDGDPLSIMVRRMDDEYDVDVDGQDGPVLRLRGFRMIDTEPLPPGDRIVAPEGGWPSAVVGEASSIRPVDDDGVLLRSELTAVETALIDSRGTARRKADRTAGRAAARRAVVKLTGAKPDEFAIVNEPDGRPIVVGLDVDGRPVDSESPIVREWPRVSISHRDGHAVAIATWSGWPGVDLEVPEPRALSFFDTWFSDQERELVGDSVLAQTQVWTVKEAVLKALGTGLAIDALDVRVHSLGRRKVDVRLVNHAAARHALLGGGDLVVTLSRESGMVMATCLLMDGPAGRHAVA